ncbi:MAG: hypothetical protein ACJAVI_002329 [Candidatus Azotimanducaceae bacterium]|jgi:hypothetical protein
MNSHIWIRAEYKENERRVAVVPEDAAKLIERGFKITVEKSALRAIPISGFEQVGCTVAEAGSWRSAPKDSFILGVKELPNDDSELQHRHIYFGHVFKDQPGWQNTLNRFRTGGGVLYDLECLVDENNRRVAAFGYWAGFAGAATAVMTWCGQQRREKPPLVSLESYPHVDELIAYLKTSLEQFDDTPSMVVIGALGRSGSGAVALADQLGINVSKWDLAETASGGPFPELLQHSIFVNCILANKSCPRFITAKDLEIKDRSLSVISDVSCDPESEYNPIPIYHHCTTFADPVISVLDEDLPLDLVAIDHLPSLLPLEASQDYSHQLVQALLTLDEPTKEIWGRALEQFNTHSARI